MSVPIDRQSGATRLEIGFIAVIVLTVGLLAFAKYNEVSIASKGAVESGLIEAVRSGIDDYAYEAQSKKMSRIYPPFLDEAKLGPATGKNLFFSLVLDKRMVVSSGIAVAGWLKTAPNEYRTPKGKIYVYNPETGIFDVAATAQGQADNN